MDANFRLKNQLVSNYSADPGLGTGMAYMVERVPYESYVLSRADEADVRRTLAIVRKALTKPSIDQHLCRFGCSCTSKYKVFERAPIHWSRRRCVCQVRDDLAKRGG
jgi:hypothetical protein